MYAHRSQPSVLVQEVVVINHGVCTQTSVPYYKCHVPITRLRSLVKLFNSQLLVNQIQIMLLYVLLNKS